MYVESVVAPLLHDLMLSHSVNAENQYLSICVGIFEDKVLHTQLCKDETHTCMS